MLKKVFLLIVFMLMVNLSVAYAGGDGGPLIMAYNLNFNPINEYLSTYSLPAIDPPVILWGGAGTSWLNESFGMGAVIAGGHRSSFKDNKMARFFCVFALLQLKNIISDKGSSKTYLIYGPGLMYLYLGLGGDNGGEFIAYNMLVYGGIGTQLTVSETTSIEFRIGYNVVPRKSWDSISGNLTVPGEFSGSGFNGSISLFFGG
jgi:hypothetical protein